ncbi:MAG: hypothetical protein GY765_15170 [bacterium]|nr:hypothetical protein [bacterium]
MKKSILLLAFLCFCACGLSASDFKMEKDLTIPAGEIYPQSIICFQGKITVQGAVKSSVLMIGGELVLDGEVGEDVICMGTTVTIGKNAHIIRDLYVIGGTLKKDEGVKIGGEYFYFKFDMEKIENTLLPFLGDSSTITFFKAVKTILWFIIALVVFALFPDKISRAEEIFDTHRMRICTIGLMSVFSFIFLMFCSILLSLIYIGIPLMIMLILLYFVIYVFGRIAMFYFIGRKFAGLIKKRNIASAVLIMMGILVYAVVYAGISFIPIVGSVVVVLLNIIELGIGIGYFMRKRLKLENRS